MNDIEMVDYAESEQAYVNFMTPAIRSAIGSLGLPAGATVLDAGCGPGSVIPLFFEAPVRADAVIGVDASIPHLRVARSAVDRSELKHRVQLYQQDLSQKLAFEESEFDVAWFSNVLPLTGDDQLTLTSLSNVMRRLKTNGKIAIFYGNWLRLTLLPGHAAVENLIGAWNELQRNHNHPWSIDHHPERSANWLRKIGMENISISHHPVHYESPLDRQIRDYIRWHIEVIYGRIVNYVELGRSVPDSLLSSMREAIQTDALTELLEDPDYYCGASALLVSGHK
jgi:SAM-dependent methyltransferase